MKLSWKKLTDKVKGVKKTDCLVIVLIGIMLLIVVAPVRARSRNTTTVLQMQNQPLAQEEEYEMERELEELLGAMEGVGKVKVMLVWEENKSSSMIGNTTSVAGIVVLSEGASHPAVRAKIESTLESLFAIEPHRITIENLSQEGSKQ